MITINLSANDLLRIARRLRALQRMASKARMAELEKTVSNPCILEMIEATMQEDQRLLNIIENYKPATRSVSNDKRKKL